MSLTIPWSLPKFMSIELVMLFNHLILYCPLLLLPSIFPSIRVFSNKLALHIRLPTYWSFSLSWSPSSEYSVLTSFRIDWFDLLGVQGTLWSLLQHHSLKAWIRQHSVFFMVQLYMIDTSVWYVCMVHLYGTSVNDYWKNHSFEYMELCLQSNVCVF